MSWLVGVLIVVVAAAAAIDFRTRRIPNWLTFSSLALGLLLQGVFFGGSGLVQGLLGVLVGAGVFFPFFALGGMGAGDVKLMGAAGAFLGPGGALSAALFTGLAGGVLVLFWGLLQGRLGSVFARTGALVKHLDPRHAAATPLPTLQTGKSWTIPYGVAIAFGVALSVWWRGV